MAVAAEPERVAEGRRYRFTVDEFARMGEAGIFTEDDRVELIDGEILEMTPIGALHAGVVSRLTELLVTRPGRQGVRERPESDSTGRPHGTATGSGGGAAQRESLHPIGIRGGDIHLVIEWPTRPCATTSRRRSSIREGGRPGDVARGPGGRRDHRLHGAPPDGDTRSSRCDSVEAGWRRRGCRISPSRLTTSSVRDDSPAAIVAGTECRGTGPRDAGRLRFRAPTSDSRGDQTDAPTNRDCAACGGAAHRGATDREATTCGLPPGPAPARDERPRHGGGAAAQVTPVTDATLQDPPAEDWLMWRRTLDSWGYSPSTR